MKRYCPVCGATWSWSLSKIGGNRHRAMLRQWPPHVWQCFQDQGGPWRPSGSRERWETVSAANTVWQGKRIALIRDSVVGAEPDDPWTRHPRCQSCGRVSSHTVSGALHGLADGFEVQHILPRSRGGESHPRNLAVLCRPCHLITFKLGYKGIPGVRATGQARLP